MYTRRYNKKAPSKKAYSKKGYSKKPLYPSKYLNKGKFSASPDIICFMPKGTQNPFPPRWRTKFVASFYSSTTSGAGSGDYALQFKLNSPITPLNYANTGLTFHLPAGITTATYMPAGLETLFNALIYQEGRVYASAIELDIIPQSVNDSVMATITPSSSVDPNTVAQAMTQPYVKQAFFSSGRQTTPKGNALKNYMTIAKLMGVSHRAVQDDISGTLQFQAAPTDPNILFTWNVNIETGDNQALVNPLEIRANITYYVELWYNNSARLPIQ